MFTEFVLFFGNSFMYVHILIRFGDLGFWVSGLGSTGEAEAEARAVLDRLVVVRVAQCLRGVWGLGFVF